MRVLFDITHPADVHLFRNAIAQLRAKGAQILVTSRHKEVTFELLDQYQIAHTPISSMKSGLAGLGGELVLRNLRMLGVVRRFRPDVLVSRIGISIGLPGLLNGIPRLVFEDTEHAWLQRVLSLPLATRIVSGFGYSAEHGERHLRFQAHPVMAYMGPGVFTPDPSVLEKYGLDPDKPLVLLRMVSWQAAHDRGRRGPSEGELASAIAELERHARVLLSMEGEVPTSLSPWLNPLPPRDLHHLLAHCRLVIGDSGSVSAEAAVLGVPAIYTSTLMTGYLRDLEERWGLVHNTGDLQAGLAVANELLLDPASSQRYKQRRQALLEQSEDVTRFIVGLVSQAARGA